MSNARRTEEAAREFKRVFHERLAAFPSVFRIVEYLPDIMFFMKDRQGRITAASHNFAILMGGRCEEDILGLDAFDMCPQKLAEQYTEDDRKVMELEEPLVGHLELVQGPDGVTGWVITNKVPVYDREHRVIGLAGMTRSVTDSRLLLQPYEEFTPVMRYIHAHLGDRIAIPKLAGMLHMSLNCFERKFKRVFGMSPAKYLINIRVHEAAKLLTTTAKSVCEIAGTVGFFDQSALTRNFGSIMGTTPAAYRRSRTTAKATRRSSRSRSSG